MSNNSKSVSVIINTYNRGWHLKRLLDTLTRQSYDNFEVVVVNGPSTDNTEDILKKYESAIKIESCPAVNLCLSRNIGIKASSGDIVAFIDDDAVPADKYWIKNAVSSFVDESIGAVGGDVKRINGDIEFSCGYATPYGDDFVHGSISENHNTPYGDKYNRVQGANCFFRKSALSDIGGFDEYYEYYLDESDVCVRLIDIGYKVIHSPFCATIHEAAKGVNRKSEYHLNWYVIARSLGYYVVKSSSNRGLNDEKRRDLASFSPTSQKWYSNFKWMLENKKISKQDYNEFTNNVKNGLQDGIKAGFEQERKVNKSLYSVDNDFYQFDKYISRDNLNIVLLSDKDITNTVGGVQMYTQLLSNGFTSMGHNVHVISRGEKELMSNRNGINTYYINPEKLNLTDLVDMSNCSRVIDFSYACHKKIKQLNLIFGIDIIETPIWDSNGLISAHLLNIPVITRLQTPLKMVVSTHEMELNNDLSLLTDFEKSMIDASSGVIAISDCIKDTIEELYHLHFQQPLIKNYLGIPPIASTKSNRKENNKIIIFFIGRLERRKGIDVLLDAITRLAPKYIDAEFRLAGEADIHDDIINNTFKRKFKKDNGNKKWFSRVSFLGKISDIEKEQEFANCDIFVSPSLYESFGIIFIEAMRYSKPTIGCNAGGMPEIIIDGKTGFLAEPGDPISLEKTLSKLIEDKNLREEMGKEGYKRLLTHFSDKAMCEGTIDFYKRIIKSKFS